MTVEPVAAAVILGHLREGASALDDEGIVTGLALAFSAVVRGHEQGQLSGPMRHRLIEALFRAEDAARGVLPTWFYDQRVRHGCLSVFGLISAWAEPPGSTERRIAVPLGTVQIARIVSNDLNSLCESLDLQRLDPTAPVTSPVLAAPAATMH
ncbi:hypothetical protein FV219_06045 [Methylobacterium sp. WL122]|nr:hypothetical protein FV219_06045 [Methylobacterium sp. WL122]